jgi:hypothetical protein
MHNTSQLISGIKHVEESLMETWGSIVGTCSSIKYALELIAEGEIEDIPRVLANALEAAEDACGLIKALLGVPPPTEFHDEELFPLTTAPIDEE